MLEQPYASVVVGELISLLHKAVKGAPGFGWMMKDMCGVTDTCFIHKKLTQQEITD
jgi:hypothetical protein